MNYIAKVKDFNDASGCPNPTNPTIPDADRVKLRLGLIQEELNEIFDAIAKNDIIGVADGFGDLQYVVSGAILEFGLDKLFPTIFNGIHQSNMSKFCFTEKEAIDTVKWYAETQNLEVFYRIVNHLYVIYRVSDNKVLKSINYTPVNLQYVKLFANITKLKT